MPRLFDVIRNKDHSGISGTGKVATGVVFDNGWLVCQWICRPGKETLETHMSLDCFLEIHGHNGSTEVKFINGSD